MVSVLPASSAVASGPLPRMSDGNKTATIYGLLRDQQYATAIQLLTAQLHTQPRSRAALSLLAYSYYHTADYQSAAQCYAQLTELCPDAADYRFSWAQSLHKAGLYSDSLDAVQPLSSQPEWQQRLLSLTASVCFDQQRTAEAAAALAQCQADDTTMFARACLQYREGQFQQALDSFSLIESNSGPAADLSYGMAACQYRMQQLPQALKMLTEHIEKQVKLHPQLAVGARIDSAAAASHQLPSAAAAAAAAASPPAVLSVGNSATLRDSFLIESFNLKAAIEYAMQSPSHARDSLLDMPPRDEHELDVVTLHNTALLYMDDEPEENMRRLSHVLTQPHFPAESFNNLLLFYLKYGYSQLCADVMAENAELSASLTPDTYHFLECSILSHSSPAEAYRRCEQIAAAAIDRLRQCTKKIQDLRHGHDTGDGIKAELKQYDSIVDGFLPIAMLQCQIYWQRQNYEQVEKILTMYAEFLSESSAYKMNVAHCCFMQETKYREAIKYYELICKKRYNDVLSILPSILANLCVSYIMCSENEEAEELMRLIEKEEEAKKSTPPSHLSTGSSSQPYHLCIVNLVIGTLYCSKGNFEFGLSRIVKSFDPMKEKLNIDTWYYGKLNVLNVLEYAAKHMIVLKKELYAELESFLTDCEKHGKGVKVWLPGEKRAEANGGAEVWKNSVAYEARLLKSLLNKLKL